MTLRERFEAVFRGEKPDAMVFFGDLTYWYAAHEIKGDLPGRWRGGRGIGKVHRELNVGEYVPGCTAYREIEGCDYKEENLKDDLVKTWKTSAGELTSIQEWSDITFSHGFKKHPVSKVEDLKILREVLRRRRYEPGRDAFRKTDEDYGDFGIAINAVQGSPLAELNKWWAGIMDLCYLIADAPEEVNKTLELIARNQDYIYRFTAESECPYVMICENLSGATMGGFFDGYIKDYLREKIKFLHSSGKKVIIHVDGTLKGAAEKLSSTGVDCLDAVTPKPVGDVGMDEIRKLTGDDVLILGGLPGAMFAPPFTLNDMEKHVKEIIKIHKDSGKFMFGVADQVPPDGDLAKVKLVGELVEEYGRY
jgi:uroporphyrinogen-III decarboxylase